MSYTELDSSSHREECTRRYRIPRSPCTTDASQSCRGRRFVVRSYRFIGGYYRWCLVCRLPIREEQVSAVPIDSGQSLQLAISAYTSVITDNVSLHVGPTHEIPDDVLVQDVSLLAPTWITDNDHMSDVSLLGTI